MRTAPLSSISTLAGFRSRWSTPCAWAAASPAAQLLSDFQHAFRGETAGMAKQCGEVLTLDELHRVEDLAVGLADVEHAAHGRVRNLPREPHLFEDPLAFGVSGRIDELQRNRRVEDEVVGAPDLSHPAAPDARHHAVTAGEHESRRNAQILLSLKLNGRV